MDKINFKNLPDTTTPVNATNLNQLQTNVEKEIFIADSKSASMNWNDLVNNGAKYRITSVKGLSSGETRGEGAPPDNAYTYGTLITLNPRGATNADYTQTQIYISDYLTSAETTRGIWVRKAQQEWCRLVKDTELIPKSVTSQVSAETGYKFNNAQIHTVGKLCVANFMCEGASDPQTLVHDEIIASGFPKPTSQIIVMGIPLSDTLDSDFKMCRFRLDASGNLRTYWPIGGLFWKNGKPRIFNFCYAVE